jgi:hypothetical protein
MAGVAVNFRWPVNMMAFGTNLGFAGGKVGRRMRVGAGGAGFIRQRLLIAMTVEANGIRRHLLRRLFPMALRAFNSCSAVDINEKRVVLGMQCPTRDGRRYGARHKKQQHHWYQFFHF